MNNERPFYASNEINELMKALCAAQAEVKSAKKCGTNPHFRATYARLEDVISEVQPVATKHGLVVWTGGAVRDGQQISITTIFHTSGQWICTEYLMGSNLTPQQIGSAQTYFRRYAQQGGFNQPSEDDDGHAASQTQPTIRPLPSSNAAMCCGNRMMISKYDTNMFYCPKCKKKMPINQAVTKSIPQHVKDFDGPPDDFDVDRMEYELAQQKEQ